MSAKKEVVLIPFWIEEIMRRNSLPLSACLEFPKIRGIVSLDDLVGFATLQQYYSYTTGAELVETNLRSIWHTSIPAGYPELAKFCNDVLMTLSLDESFQKAVVTRLFDADSRTSVYKEPFITYDLTPATIGVVIYPGFFDREHNTELQKSLVEAILKLLYVYESSHEVARSLLFKRYLELLSI